jgi:hypothetical protein
MIGVSLDAGEPLGALQGGTLEADATACTILAGM